MKIKRKILTASLLLGSISVFFLFFAILPLLKEIEKSSSEYRTAKEKLFFFENRSLTIEKTKKEYEESLKEYIEKTESFFVDSEIPIEFIKFLEKTAVASNVSIEITPFSLKAPEDDSWNSMGFQINAEAESFGNFLKFLEKIERSPYLVDVQGLNVRKTVENEIKFSISIKVFSK